MSRHGHAGCDHSSRVDCIADRRRCRRFTNRMARGYGRGSDITRRHPERSFVALETRRTDRSVATDVRRCGRAIDACCRHSIVLFSHAPVGDTPAVFTYLGAAIRTARVRRQRDSPRLSDPSGTGERQATRVAGQRRDHAGAARRDRSAGAVL